MDARPLAYPNTGIGRYTAELLKRLLDTPYQWFLYSDKPLEINWNNIDCATIRSGRKWWPVGGTVAAQLFFPFWANKDEIDLFWSPRHHLPIALPEKVKAIVTIHDMVWKNCPETMSAMRRLVDALLMPLALRRATRIISVSDATKNDLCKAYPDVADRVRRIYPGCFNDGLMRRVGMSDNLVYEDRYFLFVGTFEPRKNIPLLLRSYAEASMHADKFPRLCLVGNKGWMRDSVEDLIRSAGIEDKVEVRYGVSDNDLARMYKGALALVMPSKYEGFGLPIVEAMSIGVPAIVSRVSAMPEVVGDGGVAVAVNSVSELVLAMRRIAMDREYHSHLAACAIRQARRFNWDAAADKTIKLFNVEL